MWLHLIVIHFLKLLSVSVLCPVLIDSNMEFVIAYRRFNFLFYDWWWWCSCNPSVGLVHWSTKFREWNNSFAPCSKHSESITVVIGEWEMRWGMRRTRGDWRRDLLRLTLRWDGWLSAVHGPVVNKTHSLSTREIK